MTYKATWESCPKCGDAPWNYGVEELDGLCFAHYIWENTPENESLLNYALRVEATKEKVSI